MPSAATELDGLEVEVTPSKTAARHATFSKTILDYVVAQINGKETGAGVTFRHSTLEKMREVVAAYVYAKEGFLIRPTYLKGGTKIVEENGKFCFFIAKVGKPWSQKWAEEKLAGSSDAE